MTSIDFQSLLRQEKAKQRAELLKISSQTKNDEEGRAAQSLSGSAFGVEDINTASKHTHPFDGAPNDSVRVETGGDNSALCNDTEREEPQAGCTGHDSTSLAFTGLSIRRPLDMETASFVCCGRQLDSVVTLFCSPHRVILCTTPQRPACPC